ncbi:MAG: hypothetical protein QOG45_34 [Chloroflexota bacterium]|nr:hypothetical protein [Chloroflexota bacterium]
MQAEPEQPTSPAERDYRRVYNIWAFTLFGAVSVVAFLVLVLRHHEIATALVLGMAWGAVPQGLAWGVAGAVAPGALIRLRQFLIRGNTGALKDLGDHFSRRMGAEGPTPWENPTACRRVRRQELIQLAVGERWCSPCFSSPLRSTSSTTRSCPREPGIHRSRSS